MKWDQRVINASHWDGFGVLDCQTWVHPPRGTRKFLTFSQAWKTGPNPDGGESLAGSCPLSADSLEPGVERRRVGTGIGNGIQRLCPRPLTGKGRLHSCKAFDSRFADHCSWWFS